VVFPSIPSGRALKMAASPRRGGTSAMETQLLSAKLALSFMASLSMESFASLDDMLFLGKFNIHFLDRL
jgi:hypothetical protein